MIVNERETPEGRLVSVCDEAVLGETFDNDGVPFEVDEAFDDGERADEERGALEQRPTLADERARKPAVGERAPPAGSQDTRPDGAHRDDERHGREPPVTGVEGGRAADDRAERHAEDGALPGEARPFRGQARVARERDVGVHTARPRAKAARSNPRRTTPATSVGSAPGTGSGCPRRRARSLARQRWSA